MTGRAAKSAPQLPLRCVGSALAAAIATVTIFVASLSIAQTSATASTPPASAANVNAQSSVPPAPLPVDTAFPLLASFDRKGAVTLKVDVLPGHYLYREKFEFSSDGGASYGLDRFRQSKDASGKPKNDANFGLVKVFEAPLTLIAGQSARAKTVLTVTYQGCSEVAGVCYPPTRRTFELAAGASGVVAKESAKPALGQLFKKNVSQ
jgi:thioredoxin:protein disulfide reductase